MWRECYFFHLTLRWRFLPLNKGAEVKKEKESVRNLGNAIKESVEIPTGEAGIQMKVSFALEDKLKRGFAVQNQGVSDLY